MSGAVFDRKNNGTDWKEIKKEVIPIPACVAILGGKAVLSQYKDESSVSIFLRDVDSGEDSFLFEAEEQKSIDLGISISIEKIPAYSSAYITYDENVFIIILYQQ